MKQTTPQNLDEQRYRILIDNAPEAVMIFDADSGRFIDFNQNALDFFRLSPEKMRATGPIEMSPVLINGEPAIDHAKQFIMAALNGANPVFDWVHIDSLGEEKSCEVRIVRLPPYDQKLLRGSIIDKSHQKKIEEELRESKERLRVSEEKFSKAFYAHITPMQIFNIKTGMRVDMNESFYKLLGVDEQKFRKGNIYTDSHWQNPDNQNKAIEILKKGKVLSNYPAEIKTPFGITKSVLINAVLLDIGDNDLAIASFFDITKEKEAERQKIRASQLELKNKELVQFAYVASHDLQEPLRTLKSFSQLLQRKYGDELDQTASEYLEFISHAASRMSNLVKALLEYSQIGSNKHMKDVDCNALLENILEDLTAQTSETGAIIKTDPLPVLRGYQTELRILFQNLISNAIKFRKKEGTPEIRISVKRASEHWQFSVADNGIGIAEPYQEKIFVIFKRLHNMTEYAGTGIGLAHCQKIVDLHGGKIWVESTLGKGSTFYFTIQA